MVIALLPPRTKFQFTVLTDRHQDTDGGPGKLKPFQQAATGDIAYKMQPFDFGHDAR
jgi:hypothetical protein